MNYWYFAGALAYAAIAACTGTEKSAQPDETKPVAPMEAAKPTHSVSGVVSGAFGSLVQYRRSRAIMVKRGRAVIELVRNKQISELRKLFTVEFSRAL